MSSIPVENCPIKIHYNFSGQKELFTNAQAVSSLTVRRIIGIRSSSVSPDISPNSSAVRLHRFFKVQ